MSGPAGSGIDAVLKRRNDSTVRALILKMYRAIGVHSNPGSSRSLLSGLASESEEGVGEVGPAPHPPSHTTPACVPCLELSRWASAPRPERRSQCPRPATLTRSLCPPTSSLEQEAVPGTSGQQHGIAFTPTTSAS
jgi:hypothetical protein